MQAICDAARNSGILLPGCSESVALGSPIQISSVSGNPREVQPSHQQQLAQHFHVLANAETLKLALAGTPVQLMPLMMEAVCQFIEASGHGLKLSRSDRVLQVCCGPRYMNKLVCGHVQQCAKPGGLCRSVSLPE